MSKSAASVLVGNPVEGPPRWMSMTRSGSSRLMPKLIVSDFNATPGTARRRHAEVTRERGAER